jgi:hypothetical protein
MKSPRDRAREALTVLIHETGTATVCLSGITLADMRVDLETRLADAIAEAEDDAVKEALARTPPAPAPQWQPMDTVPDNVYVLLAERRPSTSSDLRLHPSTAKEIIVVTVGKHYWSGADPEWQRYGIGSIEKSLLVGWMPLPDPPAASSSPRAPHTEPA